jgi:hypothetical protein
MTQLASLAWKEWHEVRWFLIVALCLFVGMPIAGSIEGHVSGSFRHFFFDAAPWVLTLGGALAVIIAVGTVCSDLGGRREDFLRSRPLNLLRWVLVKYLVGLAAALVACMLPLVVEMSVNNFSAFHTNIAITWYPFFWIALYTLAFLSAVLVRRTAHAMMLALAAMLLMYFLPVVLPFLQYMSIDWVLDRSQELAYHGKSYSLPWGAHFELRQLLFIACMLGVSATALATTMLAIARNWRIESGTKMMYWSVGSALLILFTSASLRLATNLPIEQQVDLPKSQMIWVMQMQGMRGILLTSDHEWASGTTAHTIEVSDSGLKLGPPVILGDQNHRFWRNYVAWSDANPDVVYLSDYSSSLEYPRPYDLRTISLASGREIAPPIRIWESVSPKDDVGRPRLAVIDNRLYGMGGKVAVIDISEPATPHLLSVEKVRYQRVDGHTAAQVQGGIWSPLPQIAGLSPRQRLQLRNDFGEDPLNGDIRCSSYGDSLWTYRLDQLDEKVAHFSPVGHYEPTLLEHVFGSMPNGVTLGGGMAYLCQRNTLDTLGAKSSHRLIVFDVGDPQRPRPVGHFALLAEHPLNVYPLPDGRAIIATDNRLILFGKPRTKE